MPGDEVVQLYLTHDGVKGAALHELHGFQRIHLNRGETKTVALTLHDRDLSVVDESGKRRIEQGTVKAWVGGRQPGTEEEAIKTAGVITQFSISSDEDLPE
jgi:beta-glucosidase